MKLLFDGNLAARLVESLRDFYPGGKYLINDERLLRPNDPTRLARITSLPHKSLAGVIEWTRIGVEAMMHDDDNEPIVVAIDDLRPETFTALVEEYVTREGTDYGHDEYDLAQKVDAVRRQVERGEARIVFDAAAERVNIVAVR